jgi:nitric oxide reductase subunit B
MKTTTKLWLAFGLVVSLSFAVLLYYGFEIYQKAPPVPLKVVTTDNAELFSGQDIKDGQNVWQSMGGQEVGSIWGHGAYVAPDWTADWLHREALYILNFWAQHANTYDKLSEETKAGLQIRLQKELRTNTYNPETKVLTISPLRAQAFEHLRGYYSSLFTDDPAFNELRDNYAIPKNAIKGANRLRQMNTFFFWASWACVTNRPGENVSYTHNWPPLGMCDKSAGRERILYAQLAA